MADAPLTRPSLLVRIKDLADRQAWERFVELYAPLVYGFARKRGLQEADASDLTQEVLRAVVPAAGRPDRCAAPRPQSEGVAVGPRAERGARRGPPGRPTRPFRGTARTA